MVSSGYPGRRCTPWGRPSCLAELRNLARICLYVARSPRVPRAYTAWTSARRPRHGRTVEAGRAASGQD
eukprot:5698736-Pyramimonas_sp.AAC.1